MTPEEIKRLKVYATLTHTLQNYVYLREDENGKRYIEYAFIEGAPENNDCLSWYDKLQPAALKRNDHDVEEWKQNLSKVNEIYRLTRYTCDRDKHEGPEQCKPGKPCEKCTRGIVAPAMHWTYEEPVKCACWGLREIPDLLIPEKMTVNIDDIVDIFE